MGMGNDQADMCNHLHCNGHENDSLDQHTFSPSDLDLERRDECAIVVVTVKLPSQVMDGEEKTTKYCMTLRDGEHGLNSRDCTSTENKSHFSKTPDVVISTSSGDMTFDPTNITSDVDPHQSARRHGGETRTDNTYYQNNGNMTGRILHGNEGRRSKKRYNGHNHFNNATADDPDISADQSASPRRSPSPYSCGNLSVFREPGYISSQNVQENLDIPARANHDKRGDLENSSHEYDTATNPDVVSCDNRDDHKNVSNCEEADSPDKNANGHINDTSSSVPVVEYTGESPAASSNSITNGYRSVKSSEVKKDYNNAEESKQAQPFRNDCLIRISHCLHEGDGYVERRVEDVRTVTELMDVYPSLKDPIILPYARQRTYYDQWARFPRGDVGNRIYPRSSSNLSIKCWTLFQAIQNDQMKSNSAQTGSGSKQLVPNPADVTCKSLASIIEHYNQLSVLENPVFTSPAKTPPATPLKHVTAKTSSGQSSSSRSSSGNSNERGQVNSLCSQGQGPKGQSNEKQSPVPLRKKSSLSQSKSHDSQDDDVMKSNDNDVYEYNEWNGEFNRRRDTSIDEHPITLVGTLSERSHHNNCLDIAHQHKDCSSQTSFSQAAIPTAELFSSEHDLKEFNMLQQQDITDQGHQRRFHKNLSLCHPDDSPSTSNDKRKVAQSVKITVRDADDNCIEHDIGPNLKSSIEKRNETILTKDYLRNPYDVNTNTLSLNLPHELTGSNNINDFNETSFCLSRGEKRLFSYQNPGAANTFGRTRKSKTRLYFSQTMPKAERRDPSFYPTPSHHNPNQLKQSLQIHELHCPKDADYKCTRDKMAKKSGRSRSSTWKSNNKRPELPTRGYSMCERLEPSENPFGRLTLSPEMCRPRSAKQSAVSLANVHFLDLSDLKTMLRKNNTPIPRL